MEVTMIHILIYGVFLWTIDYNWDSIYENDYQNTIFSINNSIEIIDNNYSNWNSDIDKDDNFITINLSNKFKFYDQEYEKINIHLNGMITFDNDESTPYYYNTTDDYSFKYLLMKNRICF